MRKIRFGIMGCARIVRRAIAAAMRRAPSAECAAIASRDAALAARWAQEYAIPRHYGSYEAVVADPEIDAVYIPLPNEMHRTWVECAAQAGKHILCEKPLALDAAEAAAMVDACRRHGVILMEAFMWRHHPRVAHVRRMLADGQLGELRLVKMDFSFDIDRSDWRLDARRGGGALFDLGCYGINAARLFTGQEPAEVVSRSRLHSTGIDMTTAVALRFPGDTLALLDASFECVKRNRLEVVGTRASVEFPSGVLPPAESQLIVTRADGEREIVRFAEADQYAEMVESFCAAIHAGQLRDPAEDGLANMRALELAMPPRNAG